MTLAEFRFIYYMEYAHRLLGRFIGLAFLFPFLFFVFKKWLSRLMFRRAILLFLLGGLQGVVGWLIGQERPGRPASREPVPTHPAPGAGYSDLDPQPSGTPSTFGSSACARRAPHWVLCAVGAGIVLLLIGLQIAGGGFVAGLKAGHAFNTFPTMNGRWIPGSIFAMNPWISNFFENPATVQFVHRWLAMIVAAAVIWFLFRSWRELRSRRLRTANIMLAVLLATQIGLGIATLLLAVPIGLGSAHQAVALLLWSVAVFIYQQCVTHSRAWEG